MRCRADRATIRPVMRLAPFVPLVLALFAFSACGNSGPEPDRVVNVERVCEWPADSGSFERAPESFCESVFDGRATNSAIREARLKLTVRTSEGATYVIEVPPYFKVELGQAWPPAGPTPAPPPTATPTSVPTPVPTPTKIALARPTVTASGLQYEDTIVGSGAMPSKGKRVTVHYFGTFTDGKKFDSSVDRGQPFTFVFGVGQVIKGWDEGLATMRVGGERVLLVPAELAYGSHGQGPIPPNSALIFEVELLSVE